MMATKITIEIPGGLQREFFYYNGLTAGKGILAILKEGDLQTHVENVRNMSIRDDDIYLATYAKSGTHWVWEILLMLKRGNAEYETKTKEAAFLDLQPIDVVDKVPSPRVLNCHYPCHLTPRGILEKNNKIVHVMRNPRDVFVSFYHHFKVFDLGPFTESFSNFLPLMLGDYGVYQTYPWFNYVKEWERFTAAHPEQIINLYFEDLKENPVREIKKLDKFLETNRDDELIQKIAEACDFQNLKKADTEVKETEDFMKKVLGVKTSSFMYRKGEVGDWKNYFTVAQNEKMEMWLKENMCDSTLTFRDTI